MPAGDAFARLVDVVARLRGPDGCPWDREQTHDSLRPYLLEESYEVLAAIGEAAGKPHKLREELGDLLLQVLLHAAIAAERGAFTIEDVVMGLEEKLIRRHPHVFGGKAAADAKEVARNWEAIKAAEAAEATEREDAPDSVSGRLRRVPHGLPPAARAGALQREAARIGFDWDGPQPALDKLDEECAELRQALQSGDAARIRAECGDVYFSLLNVARLAGVDAEDALDAANARFVARLEAMEEAAAGQGLRLEHLDLDTLERLWQQAKGATLPESRGVEGFPGLPANEAQRHQRRGETCEQG